MIRLKTELLSALATGGKDAVLAALQKAIQLEHATIPPYLYALYSLDTSKNANIAGIIKSVVVEEMLHMTLACNVLNALGGDPALDDPMLLPAYPGPLPGAVEGDLTVHLAPFSRELVHDVFMKIEEPEDPLQFPVLALSLAQEPITIGQFYGAIKNQIIALGDEAFSSTPRHQITPDLMDDAVVVTNVVTASQAIDTIVEQGEGTPQSPLDLAGQEYAHYYRFAEIYHGRRLKKNDAAAPDAPPDQQYIYSGDAVAFDPTGVFPVPVDPKAANYPVGNAARYACDTFNYTYTSLLKTLHAAFNGQPDQLDAAIGLMMSLKQQAKDMMAGIHPENVNVGPSFEYQPVNP